MLLFVGVIALIIAVTLFGSWYARRYESPDGLIALHVIFTAMSQLTAVKIATFDLGLAQFHAPAAMIVFPVTFLITDIVNEKFGRRQVHAMIFLTFGTQVFMVFILSLAGALPPAPFWTLQGAWDELLGFVFRIMLASWATFLLSENLDAWLYSAFRRLTGGRHLWARNVFSTLPALTLDTVVFVTLAFAGTGLPLWPLMLGQFATKYLVGVLSLPFMYLNRAVLGPPDLKARGAEDA